MRESQAELECSGSRARLNSNHRHGTVSAIGLELWCLVRHLQISLIPAASDEPLELEGSILRQNAFVRCIFSLLTPSKCQMHQNSQAIVFSRFTLMLELILAMAAWPSARSLLPSPTIHGVCPNSGGTCDPHIGYIKGQCTALTPRPLGPALERLIAERGKDSRTVHAHEGRQVVIASTVATQTVRARQQAARIYHDLHPLA